MAEKVVVGSNQRPIQRHGELQTRSPILYGKAIVPQQSEHLYFLTHRLLLFPKPGFK